MTEPTIQPPRQSLTSASAADLLGPQEVLAIQDQGHIAGFAGESPLTCPWARATEPDDVARRDMWIRGHSAGRTDLRIARTASPPARQSPT
jgi:ribosome modulation factor